MEAEWVEGIKESGDGVVGGAHWSGSCEKRDKGPRVDFLQASPEYSQLQRRRSALWRAALSVEGRAKRDA